MLNMLNNFLILSSPLLFVVFFEKRSSAGLSSSPLRQAENKFNLVVKIKKVSQNIILNG